MEKHEWLRGYSGQSTEDLISLQNEYRIPSLVLAFEQAISQKALKETINEAENTILAVEGLEREVNNGGYRQFFINTPDFVQSIVPSLKRIGCKETAQITQRAIEALGVPSLRSDIVRSVVRADDKDRDRELHACDDLYYNNTEPIALSLFEFIKSNRDRIKI